MKIDIFQLTGEKLILHELNSDSNPEVPLRIGDFNNDGFPDILALTVDSSDKINVNILKSVADTSNPHSQTFKVARNGMADVQINGKIVGAVFMDVNDDVSNFLDLFLGILRFDCLWRKQLFNFFK